MYIIDRVADQHLGAEQVLPDMRPAMMYASEKGSVPYPA